ncbi:MAG: hypothetical protein ACREUW_03320 [Burkholderiales bacterium]
MSERPDPQDVARDPALDAAYREGARDEPPARLDDAIRAAARREVGARPQSAGGGGFKAWRVPVSIAAMLVIGVSVVTLVREEHPEVLQATPPATSRPGSPPPALAAVPEADAAKRLPPYPQYQYREEEGGRAKNEALRDQAAAKDAAAAAPAPERKLEAMPREAPAAAGSVAAQAPVAREEKEKLRMEVQPGRRDTSDAAGSVARNNVAETAEPQRQTPQAELRSAEVPAPSVQARAKSDAAPKPDPAPASAIAADSMAQAAPRPEPPPPAMKPAPIPQAKPAAKPAPRPEFSAPVAPSAPPVVSGLTQPAPPLAKAQAEGDYAGLDTPDKWLVRIRELRKQGRLTEAAKVLAEFRQRHPGYALPPDLAEGIKP